MIAKFETLTEDKKIFAVYNFAFMNAIILNNKTPESDREYKNELKALIDWLKPKVGLEGANVY